MPKLNRKRIAAGLLLIMGLICWLALAGLALETRANPQPVTIGERLDKAAVQFDISQTRTLFAGDCLMLSWRVEGAAAVTVSEAAVPNEGSLLHCDGTGPVLRITLPDGTSWARAVYHWALFDQAAAHGLLFGGLALVLGGMAILGAGSWQVWGRGWAQWALVIGFAVGFTALLDAFTNQLNTARYTWDFVHYIDMAENGISGNAGLVAPYAYRPLPSMLAGVLIEVSGRGTVTAFRAIAYAATISHLILAYVLARLYMSTPARRFWGAFAVMLLAAFATFSVKFYLFDVFRPDPLAFPLMLLGMIGMTQVQRGARRIPWVLLTLGCGVAGAFVREFAVLPALILALVVLWDGMRWRRASSVGWGLVLAGVMSAALLLPRLLIPVGRTDQVLDVVGIGGLLAMGPRNENLLAGLLVALLPVWVLLTPRRLGVLWHGLKGMRLALAAYTLAVLALSFVGGTDISRFYAYLVVPMIVCSAVLIDRAASTAEVLYALLAQVVFNRTFASVPMQSIDAYLDFYIVYWDRQTAVTLSRLVEALAWIGGAWGVRLLAGRRPEPVTADRASPAAG